jgi:hypothetical protein
MKNSLSPTHKLIKIALIILSAFQILIHFLNPASVHAEAGLSEAGRTNYYFFKDDYAISILPGTKSTTTVDRVRIFEYQIADDETKNLEIKGQDGNIYEAKDKGFSHGFSIPPVIDGEYLWTPFSITNYKTGEMLYKETFACPDSTVDNLLESVKKYDINDPECSDFQAKKQELNLIPNYADGKHLDSEYAKKNLEFMGKEQGLHDLANFMGTYLIVLVLLILCGVAGIILVLIGIVRLIIKKKGWKLIIIGLILTLLPIIIIFAFYFFILTEVQNQAANLRI